MPSFGTKLGQGSAHGASTGVTPELTGHYKDTPQEAPECPRGLKLTQFKKAGLVKHAALPKSKKSTQSTKTQTTVKQLYRHALPVGV